MTEDRINNCLALVFPVVSSDNTIEGKSDGLMKVPLQEALLRLRSGGIPSVSNEEYASVMGVKPPGRRSHEIILVLEIQHAHI